MSPVVRWGILGTAAIAVNHVIPAIKETSGCAVTAIGSRDPQRAAQVADKFGIDRAYGSYADLLADDAVDCVYVPLPNSMHRHWTLLAMAAGKSVLCEKPLAQTSADVRQMIEAADSSGVLLAEGFMYRHHAQIQWLLDFAARGELGNIQVIRGSIGFIAGQPPDIRLDPALGGGALLDVGCYPLDAMCLLYGGPPVTARAMGFTDGGVDHVCAAVLEFPGERIGLMDATFRLPWLHVPLEVAGDEGTVRLDNVCNPGRSPSAGLLLRPGRQPQPLVFDGMDAYAAMIGSFRDSFRSGAPSTFGLRASEATARGIDLVRDAMAVSSHEMRKR